MRLPDALIAQCLDVRLDTLEYPLRNFAVVGAAYFCRILSVDFKKALSLRVVIQALRLCIRILTALMNLAAVNIAYVVAVLDKDDNPTANGLLCMILARLLRENGSLQFRVSRKSLNFNLLQGISAMAGRKPSAKILPGFFLRIAILTSLIFKISSIEISSR